MRSPTALRPALPAAPLARLAALALTLAVTLAAPRAAGAQGAPAAAAAGAATNAAPVALPEGWRMRLDRPGARTEGMRFERAGTGLHATIPSRVST